MKTLVLPAGPSPGVLLCEGSGEAELAESGHGQLGRAPLLQLQARRDLRSDQPAVLQQAEEVEALAHPGRAGQHVVAGDQLLPGGRVGAVPQQNLHRAPGCEPRPLRAPLSRVAPPHTCLHTGVDAHVLQELPLGEWPQTGHTCSRHPAQVAEVHVGGEVRCSRSVQDVVQPVPFKRLQSHGPSVYSCACSPQAGLTW